MGNHIGDNSMCAMCATVRLDLVYVYDMCEL